MGDCWDDSISTIYRNHQNRTRKHRSNSPNSNITLRKSTYTRRSLGGGSQRWETYFGRKSQVERVTKASDVSDDEVVFIAGRTAVNLMIKRRRASALEIGLAIDICLDVELRAELARVLNPGRLNDESRKIIETVGCST